MELWFYAKWSTLALGCLFALTALSTGSPAVIGTACFLGILSRIMQAEEHHQSDSDPTS